MHVYHRFHYGSAVLRVHVLLPTMRLSIATLTSSICVLGAKVLARLLL